jgi:hygromycin-B 7''-O-kinase
MDGPPTFTTVPDYVRAVSDRSVWERWANAALADAGLPLSNGYRVGDVGTFPTLVGENGLVVKLFADMCDGIAQHEVELAAYRVLSSANLPTPKLVASGVVAPRRRSWRWPYLVVTSLPGRSYARSILSHEQRMRIASQLGVILRKLHRLQLPANGPLRRNPTRFTTMLARRRREVLRDQSVWGGLRGQLAEPIESLLPEDPADLMNEALVFVHTDVHADHVFVGPDGHDVTGIIDFADAFAADPHYELVTLHLGTFGADKRLLSAFLSAYGWPPRSRNWPRRMLAWTMLHEWNALSRLIPEQLDPAGIESLDQLATILWDVDTPPPQKRLRRISGS